MIERIKGIRIKGRCFTTDTNLLFYQNPNDRISVVYGKNGSGKSTISEGIAFACQDDNSSDLSVSFIDSSILTASSEAPGRTRTRTMTPLLTIPFSSV